MPTKLDLYQHLVEVHKIKLSTSAPTRQNKQYKEEHMQQALREIMEGQSVYRSCKKFNIPAKTIRDRMKRLNIKLAPTHHSPNKQQQQQRGINFTCGICDSSFHNEEALFKHLREDDHDGIDVEDEEEEEEEDVGSLERPNKSSATTVPFEAIDEYISDEEEF